MNNDIKTLKLKFKKIEKIGWIRFDKTNLGSIGITLEKLLGITPNEFEIPDFGSIEIKTKSKSRYEYITLFNCVPTGPHYHEVERLKNLFGYPDSKLREFKVFNGEIFGNKLKKIGNKFYFKLNIYKIEKKITLSIYDNFKNKIEESIYWDFDILKEKLERKITLLALISVDKKSINGSVFFKYSTINFYKLKGFDTFIDLLEKGIVKITFKIGIFRDSKRLGKIHDRGTAFSIKKQDIDMLFDYIE